MKTTTTTKTRKATRIKRLATAALAIVMVGTMLPSNSQKHSNLFGATYITASADDSQSGTCGENATWTLDSNGKLTISGTGAMTDFTNDDMQPWRDTRSNIISVEIQDGITSIGNHAFAYCPHLSMAYIAKSVTTIGADAFNCCIALSSANIPEGVTTIGYEAFNLCSEISYANIPSSVTTIDSDAFFGCTKCKEVNIQVTDPSKLTWKDSNDDFIPGKMTICHVHSNVLDAYKTTFDSSVNVTFAADT